MKKEQKWKRHLFQGVERIKEVSQGGERRRKGEKKGNKGEKGRNRRRGEESGFVKSFVEISKRVDYSVGDERSW